MHLPIVISVSKPLSQWSKEEVAKWFKDEGFQAQYEAFKNLAGKHLIDMDKEDYLRRSPAMGRVLYKAIQKLKVPASVITGITWTCPY